MQPEPRMAREHPVSDERLVRIEKRIELLRAVNAR
jgi:predicted Zn-dependent protease